MKAETAWLLKVCAVVIVAGLVIHFGATFAFWWPLMAKSCATWP